MHEICKSGSVGAPELKSRGDPAFSDLLTWALHAGACDVLAVAEQRCGVLEQPERREQAIGRAVGRITIGRDRRPVGELGIGWERFALRRLRRPPTVGDRGEKSRTGLGSHLRPAYLGSSPTRITPGMSGGLESTRDATRGGVNGPARRPRRGGKPLSIDAAKILGLDRKTLYRKLLRWGISDE